MTGQLKTQKVVNTTLENWKSVPPHLFDDAETHAPLTIGDDTIPQMALGLLWLHNIQIRAVSSYLLFLALVHSIPSWLAQAKIKCTVRVFLPKESINQFKSVQQSRQQGLRSYCSNVYTVIFLFCNHVSCLERRHTSTALS